MTTTQTISNILLRIGVPYNVYGSKYLQRAIEIALSDFNAVNFITTRIYLAIAKENNTKVANIERAIRHAIQIAWNKNKIIELNKIFNVEIFSSKDKPSNGELIALIAERIKYYQEN